MLLASAVIVRLLWQTERLHNERLSNAYQQYSTAKILLESRAPEDAATLWNLHWIATQKRFENYVSEAHWPRLSMLYFERPYQLNNRIEKIGGRANDGLETPVPTAANSTLLSGLRAVIDELEAKPATYSEILKLATLAIIPALLLWIFLYHLLVYLPDRKRSYQVAAELQHRDSQLDTLTYSDPLTDTANRKAITQFLSDYQASSKPSSKPNSNAGEFIALAILDLDHFQQINDVFGYFAGDAVLKEVADRIQAELREADQLGRLDSDRYALVLCDLISPKNAEQIIDRIQQAISHPIHYHKNTLNITCTVGAAVQHVDSIEIADLFKLCDQALYQAKLHRRGSVFLLSDQQQEALGRQRQIINTLKNKTPEEIFNLAFQPIVDMQTRKITGCECLLRWTAEQPEHLGAAELVPILEMFGDINEVGLWVIKNSLQQLQDWQSRYDLKDFVMSINLSAGQLDAEDISSQILTLARDMNLQPHCISLELTETVAIKHLEAGRHQLAQLRNHGFHVSIDDFGTGYSSLQYLKNMPASSVKIDQSFVQELMNDERDMAIVKGAVDIASAIGLTVIAEGIDTEEQAGCLQKLGCQKGQGFLFSKPLTAAEFEYRLSPHDAAVKSTFDKPSAA